MKKTYDIRVIQNVRVTLDESKFTEEWMAEFRRSFYQMNSTMEHAEHIAQLEARGVYGWGITKDTFIEGYGPAGEMGISVESMGTETECEHVGVLP